MSKPPKSILDPTFRYTPAHETDIRKLFDKVRREQKQVKLALVTELKRKAP